MFGVKGNALDLKDKNINGSSNGKTTNALFRVVLIIAVVIFAMCIIIFVLFAKIRVIVLS